MHHGHRWDVAQGLPAQRHLRHGRGAEPGRFDPGPQSEGVFSVVVVDRAGLSTLRACSRERLADGYPVHQGQEQEKEVRLLRQPDSLSVRGCAGPRCWGLARPGFRRAPDIGAVLRSETPIEAAAHDTGRQIGGTKPQNACTFVRSIYLAEGGTVYSWRPRKSPGGPMSVRSATVRNRPGAADGGKPRALRLLVVDD